MSNNKNFYEKPYNSYMNNYRNHNRPSYNRRGRPKNNNRNNNRNLPRHYNHTPTFNNMSSFNSGPGRNLNHYNRSQWKNNNFHPYNNIPTANYNFNLNDQVNEDEWENSSQRSIDRKALSFKDIKYDLANKFKMLKTHICSLQNSVEVCFIFLFFKSI